LADASLALIEVALGDHGEAMRLLEKSYQGRFNPFAILMRPGFDPIPSDPTLPEPTAPAKRCDCAKRVSERSARTPYAGFCFDCMTTVRQG